MSEISAAERPEHEDVNYHGHTLKITNFTADSEWGVSVPGFVAAISENGYVKCREGFPYENADGEDVVETDMFDIFYIRNGGQEGAGTWMMSFALEEGVRRGFRKARMEIQNPRIIRIVEKLIEGGIVKSALFFEDHDRSKGFSTPELIRTVPPITAEKAKDYLASLGLDEDGYQDKGSIDCILGL